MQSGAPYPDLRGVMTWSVNWDLSSCGSDTFANTLNPYFFSKLSFDNFNKLDDRIISYLSSDELNINSSKDIVQVKVYNLLGQLIVNKSFDNLKVVQISNIAFANRQIFILEITDKYGKKSISKLY